MDYRRCSINHICSETTCYNYNKCDGNMSKYRNRKVDYKGMKFDSKKEYIRYLVLEDMERKKEISNLRRQVSFQLIPPFELDGKKYKGIKYIDDFVYQKDGKTIVEDTKGILTDVYKVKRKLMAYIHKIKIKEI